MQGNHGFITGTRKTYSLADNGAKGVHNTFDQYNARIDNKWPKVKKFVSISPNTANHFEGESKTFTVTVDGYENNDKVYYSIVAVTGSVTNSDFTDSTKTGEFTVNSSGQGSFSKTLVRDNNSETESYKVQIRDGSVSGTILGESGTITIPNPSYTLTADNSSPNEGTTVTFTLTGTNTYTGTHYYSLSGTAGSSTDVDTATTGGFSYNGSTGSFSIAIDNDFLTEGSETFTANARVNSTSGDIVAQTTVTVNDTSLTPTATCTPNVSSIDEGSSVTFTVNTTNFSSGTLQWIAILSADMEGSDISATSGTVSISSSTGTIQITATSDGYTETGQTESFQVRILNSPDGDGQTLVTSSAVTINDTSTGSPEPAGIFPNLLNLATSLASATVPSPSNLQSIQSIIENANSAFNVFAVVGYGAHSESLSGTGVAGGKRTHTATGFNYNTSSSNILSTGNTIVDMTGGSGSSLGTIDNKKWMAMAQFDGSNFDGILVWIFTGDSVNNSGTVTSGTRSVTNVRDIFYPKGTGNSDYHHFYPVAIAANGTVYSNTTSTKNGWNFSNGSGAQSATGVNSVSRMSGDDGFWGFIIPTGTNSAYVDGNSPGETIFSTSSSKPGFGMGNYNGGDTSNGYSYWNGTQDNNTDFLGFVFSGDA